MAGGSGSKEQWSSTWGFLLAAVGFAVGDATLSLLLQRAGVWPDEELSTEPAKRLAQKVEPVFYPGDPRFLLGEFQPSLGEKRHHRRLFSVVWLQLLNFLWHVLLLRQRHLQPLSSYCAPNRSSGLSSFVAHRSFHGSRSAQKSG